MIAFLGIADLKDKLLKLVKVPLNERINEENNAQDNSDDPIEIAIKMASSWAIKLAVN